MELLIVVGFLAVVVIYIIWKATEISDYEKKNQLTEEEKRSYVDESTNEIFLRASNYSKYGSEEWVVSNKAITINTMTPSNPSKTVLISQLSGIKIEKSELVRLQLYIGGGATSSSGSASNTANHTLNLDLGNLEIAQKAHDYILEQMGQLNQPVQSAQPTQPAQPTSSVVMHQINCTTCGSSYIKVQGNFLTCDSCGSAFMIEARDVTASE